LELARPGAVGDRWQLGRLPRGHRMGPHRGPFPRRSRCVLDEGVL